MPDETHLKLAHRLLTDERGERCSAIQRADMTSRAQAYATIAVAEALGRIADVLEGETVAVLSTRPTSCPATTDGVHDGAPCAHCGYTAPAPTGRPVRDDPRA